MSALRIALQQTLILPDIRKYGSILHAQEATLRRHFHYCKIRCKHVRRVRNPGRPLTAKGPHRGQRQALGRARIQLSA